ncbi:MAG: type II secretion system F family protein [Deltaproteobacteria bacterium]|nr:type II secretion system F family protein [Deltaproteobacteria bacterium]MBW1793935.1 type II secretion system F family protein [Deltaproteobacteria bacterium]MBW2331422.1 type II secretion system F family protein [Deltaproteobacteria bacterium]
MPVFIWKGEDRKGTTQKGEIEAPHERAVRAQLGRMQIKPTKIKEKPKDLFENVSFMQPKVQTAEVVVFARQFATMIDAGLPLIQSLDILYSQQENKTFKKTLKEIKDSVEQGSTLADALGKYPNIFDDLFVNMVAAGEVGGILDTILDRLSGYMEKAMKLKKQVKGAMTYPIIVLVIAALVVGVILVFVIPVFQKMFADFGGALPAPTQIVVGISNFVKGNIHYIIGAVVVFVFAFKRFYSTEKGRVLVDDIMLKLPVFGSLLRKVAVAKFTRTMSTMISSGVPILEALDIVAKTAGNKTVEAAIYKVQSAITEGRTMADPMSESGVFPSMVCQMVAVGESTGALDAMLGKIADFYDDEVDAAVGNLTAMIEPFMMAFLGVTIGGLVVSMYLPIFKMASIVGG